MEKQIINTLIELTFRGNDDVKIAAILHWVIIKLQ